MQGKIEGVITALITPFDRKGGLMAEALKKLVDFQIEQGVNAFFPCGTTGEGLLMSDAERKKVAEIVVDRANGKIPVMIHVGSLYADTVAGLTKHANDIGADAVGCITPFYYRLDDLALIEFYKWLAQLSDLPIFIYNIPQYTRITVSQTLLGELSKIPGIVGIKDSGGDLVRFGEYINTTSGDFAVLIGDDGLIFPALMMGTKGAVSAIANVFPEIVVDLFEAHQRGEYRKARGIQMKVLTIRRILKREPQLQPYKEALKMRGFDVGFVKKPIRPMTNEETEKLRNELTKGGIL